MDAYIDLESDEVKNIFIQDTITDYADSSGNHIDLEKLDESREETCAIDDNILNYGFIADADAYADELDDDNVNETLSVSQLLAKLHKQHKMLVKKDRKIKRMKKHLEGYRNIIKSYSTMLDTVFDSLDNDHDNYHE